jgi:RIO kinase 1
MKTPRRLEPLLEEGIIEEVHRQLMSGKEAVCYVVSAGGEIRVAKVYKEAQQRAFQNRATYMEGRNVRSSRDRRAIKKRTNYGKKQLEQAWQSAEVDALFRMHAAGVRVPTPYVYSEGVLLMEMVQDGDERVAPRLSDLRFGREEALELHGELMRQCVLMLLGGLVHADLSEFNVLMTPEGPVIIDFPQAMDAAANNSARRIFVRDTDNLTRFLARFAPQLRRKRFGAHIWKLYERGELTPELELDATQVQVEQSRPAREESRGSSTQGSRRRAVVEIQPSSTGSGSGRADPRRGGAEGETQEGERKKSRRRRRRGGGKPGNGATAPRREGGGERASKAAPKAKPTTTDVPGAQTAGDAPKRRRRRRRRRGGKASAASGSE